jgi:hypothetical protein
LPSKSDDGDGEMVDPVELKIELDKAARWGGLIAQE